MDDGDAHEKHDKIVTRTVRRVVSLSCEDAQDKNDWGLRIKGAGLPRFTLINGRQSVCAFMSV